MRAGGAGAAGGAVGVGTRVVDRYDALLVDLDGVVYRGDQVVAAAAATLEDVRRHGVRVLFLTNNSARTPEQVAEKLAALGVESAPEEVLTSALATAAMLRREGLAGSTAFVIGERGVLQALEDVGIRVAGGEPRQADLVVVGWDRSVDYSKLRTASLLVERGARLVATNADASYPAPDGLWPGAGAILAAVTTTTGAIPTTVGKPATPMFEAAAELTGAGRPLVVGDRLETDVGGATGMGWDSLLVLSGAARPADLTRGAVHLPTYVGRDLSAVLGGAPPTRPRPVTVADLPALKAVLAGSGLRTERVEDRLGETVVIPGPDGAVVATASVDGFGASGLLRSVAVRSDLRDQGLGMLIVAAAARSSRERGLERLFLYTETAGPFFARLGFRIIPRDDVPAPVAQAANASEECPTAVAMTLELRPTGRSAQ